MWYFVLSFIILAIGMFFIYKKTVGWNKKYPNWEDFWFGGAIFVSLGGLSLFIIGMALVLPMTTGLAPEYKQGEDVGYITSFEKTGLIWKTYEGVYLAGVGKQSAVGGPYSFSVTEPTIVTQMEKLVGTDKRVKMSYNCWFQLPYRFGETSCLVTKVAVLE